MLTILVWLCLSILYLLLYFYYDKYNELCLKLFEFIIYNNYEYYKYLKNKNAS